MNMGYGKVYPRLFTGSLSGDSDAQLVMTYAIANAGADHEVEFNLKVMAACFGPKITIPDIEAAIQRLCDPHPDSTSPKEEGRCLLPKGPRVYFLVNHEQHRDRGVDPERVRAQKAAWAKKHRQQAGAPNSSGAAPVASSSHLPLETPKPAGPPGTIFWKGIFRTQQEIEELETKIAETHLKMSAIERQKKADQEKRDRGESVPGPIMYV